MNRRKFLSILGLGTLSCAAKEDRRLADGSMPTDKPAIIYVPFDVNFPYNCTFDPCAFIEGK